MLRSPSYAQAQAQARRASLSISPVCQLFRCFPRHPPTYPAYPRVYKIKHAKLLYKPIIGGLSAWLSRVWARCAARDGQRAAWRGGPGVVREPAPLASKRPREGSKGVCACIYLL